MVVVTSVVAWVLVSQGIDLINLTGSVDPGLPSWQLPWLFNRNTTDPGQWEGPVELAQEFGIGLLMLPLVSILQHLAIAKHYAGNRKMAASQEMLALGVSQLVGSFTGSMAVTASFGRYDWGRPTIQLANMNENLDRGVVTDEVRALQWSPPKGPSWHPLLYV